MTADGLSTTAFARQRVALIIVVAVLALAWCETISARDMSIDPRIRPHDCEKWEARSRALEKSNDPVERRLGELLLQPELRFCQTRMIPVTEAKPDEQLKADWMPNLTALAGVLQWLAIAVLTGLLIWLLSKLQPGRWFKAEQKPVGKATPEDQSRDLLDPSADELGQVLEDADRAWQAGDRRRALSLLYRGAIVRIWPDERDSRARTERELLGDLKQHPTADELLSTMTTLTRLWQQSAWAHRMPGDKDFLAIRQRWAETFIDQGVGAP